MITFILFVISDCCRWLFVLQVYMSMQKDDRSPHDRDEHEAVCTICLEPIVGLERPTARLTCNHTYHLDCIGSAFNAKREMECPNCRCKQVGDWILPSSVGLSDEFHISVLGQEDIDNIGLSLSPDMYLHHLSIDEVNIPPGAVSDEALGIEPFEVDYGFISHHMQRLYTQDYTQDTIMSPSYLSDHHHQQQHQQQRQDDSPQHHNTHNEYHVDFASAYHDPDQLDIMIERRLLAGDQYPYPYQYGAASRYHSSSTERFLSSRFSPHLLYFQYDAHTSDSSDVAVDESDLEELTRSTVLAFGDRVDSNTPHTANQQLDFLSSTNTGCNFMDAQYLESSLESSDESHGIQSSQQQAQHNQTAPTFTSSTVPTLTNHPMSLYIRRQTSQMMTKVEDMSEQSYSDTFFDSLPQHADFEKCSEESDAEYYDPTYVENTADSLQDIDIWSHIHDVPSPLLRSLYDRVFFEANSLPDGNRSITSNCEFITHERNVYEDQVHNQDQNKPVTSALGERDNPHGDAIVNSRVPHVITEQDTLMQPSSHLATRPNEHVHMTMQDMDLHFHDDDDVSQRGRSRADLRQTSDIGNNKRSLGIDQPKRSSRSTERDSFFLQEEQLMKEFREFHSRSRNRPNPKDYIPNKERSTVGSSNSSRRDRKSTTHNSTRNMELDFEEEPQESLASILQRIEYPSQEHHANASNGSHRRNYRGSGDNQTRDRKRDQQEQSRSSIRERHSRTRDQTRLRNRQDTIFLQDENESLTEKAFPSFRRTDSAHLRSHRDSVRNEKGGVLPQVSGTPSSNDRVLSESTESLCYQQPSRIPFTGQIEMKSHQTRSSPKTTATASPSVVEYEEDIPEILDPSFSSQAHTTTGKSKSGSKTSHRKHKQEISSSLQLDQEESSAPSEYNKVSELLQEMGLQPPFPYLHRTYVDTDVISTPLPSPARFNQLGDLPKQSQSSSSPRQKTRAHKKTEQEQIPPSPDSKSPTSTPTARQSRRDHSFRNGDHSPLARELLPTNDTYIDQRPSVFEPDQYLTIESSPKRHPKDTVSRSAKLRDECQDFLPHHSPKASEGTLSSRPQIHSSDHDDLEYHAPPKSKRKPIIHGTRQNAHRQTRIDSIQNMDRPVSSLSPPSSSPSTPKKR